jgi:flagellar protein FlaG
MINADVALKPVTRTEALSKITGSGKPIVKPENKKFPEEEKKEYSKEDLQAAVDRTNKLLSDNNITQLKFEIHKGTGSIMVKVIDTSTDEVIREIPSEKLLDYAAGMRKLEGVIVDEKG